MKTITISLFKPDTKELVKTFDLQVKYIPRAEESIHYKGDRFVVYHVTHNIETPNQIYLAVHQV